MAVTTGGLNGSELFVYKASDDSKVVAYATSCTLNIGQDSRDISSKSCAGWQEFLEGQRNWTVDVEGLYAWTLSGGSAMTNGADDLFTNRITTRDSFSIKFGNTDSDASTDAHLYTGTAYVTSISMTGGTEDNATYSVTFQGTGELTVANV